MAERVIVTYHLPLSMGAVGKSLQVIAREYPDAVIGQNAAEGTFEVVANDDPRLTHADRRMIERRRRWTSQGIDFCRPDEGHHSKPHRGHRPSKGSD